MSTPENANAEYFDAIKAGDRSRVEQLIGETPALVNARNGISALMTAVYYGQGAIVHLLIEKGAALDIFEAAATGQLLVVQRLLAADPGLVETYSADGFQALGLAAYFGHEKVVAELIARGADVNTPSRNSQRVQPLHSAVAANRIDIVRMLVEAGADVNAVQQDEFAPLHGAAQHGTLEMIAYLIEHGAKVDAKLSDGTTPYDLAIKHEHPQAAELLPKANS